jgi:hypothetical protein
MDYTALYPGRQRNMHIHLSESLKLQYIMNLNISPLLFE